MAWKFILDALSRAWQDSYAPKREPARVAVAIVAITPDVPLDVQLRRASLLLRRAQAEDDWAGICEYTNRVDDLLDEINERQE